MLHRAGQFFRALFARVRRDEISLIAAHLSPDQLALFRRMHRSDQRHSLDVFLTLRRAGYEDRALLQAALLHDVGKAAAQLTVWHRVAVVLLGRFAAGWLDRLAVDGQGWRAPFAAHLRHVQQSAEWAALVGCSPDVVALIRDHHTPSSKDKRLAALQWADALN